MLINIETDLSTKEIDDILSDKICHKYPRFYREYDLGINWVSNKKRFLCLFYEDGTKGRWDYQTNVKSFFYGTAIKVNDKYRIIVISCVNIFFIIDTILLICLFILNTNSLDLETVSGVLFLSLIIVLFNLNIGAGNKKIREYLERIFR